MMIAFFLIFPAEAGLFGPSNYDECITESMKGVTSDVAARAIIKSCRERFPKKNKKRPPSMDLSSGQLLKITGRAGLSFGNYYAGKLYNGNRDLIITEISISVITKIGGKEVKREYRGNVHIPPLTSNDFGFDIIVGDKDADYSWDIVGAKGYNPE